MIRSFHSEYSKTSDMENENPRNIARSHPYRSPGRVNFRITHNYFSFSNNTSSLFPQQQSQPRLPNVLKPVANTNTGKSNAEESFAPKRQPFSDLSTSSNRFIKLPSSCKISESAVTLVQIQDENDGQEPMDTKSNSEDQSQIQAIAPKSSRPCLTTFQPDYLFDILTNWGNIQHRVRPRKYMDKQKEISHRMRSILIDWIVEVTIEFDCCEDTLFLAASIIDRFLSKMNVPKSKLQLIGTASLFIACKYEETTPPGIKDFVYITDDTYTKDQILRMEQIILQALNFDLMPPTAYDFVKAYCSLLQLDNQRTCLAIYLAELTLIDGERYTTILPSLVATSAVALARLTYQGPFWDDSLCALSPHIKSDVQRCADCLYASFYEAALGSHKAVFEKFKSETFGSVSMTNLPIKLPWNSF
ncbi:unnamed protein product [Allacma fusca]|uniref:Cyclin N-terminal domain-containing protein n=1 Tax=Allacma fusca TaxID=39272 RepID=A0A8J2JLR5_9HEXA|nr:unnamed protein product [Allacma fusca]